MQRAALMPQAVFSHEGTLVYAPGVSSQTPSGPSGWIGAEKSNPSECLLDRTETSASLPTDDASLSLSPILTGTFGFRIWTADIDPADVGGSGRNEQVVGRQTCCLRLAYQPHSSDLLGPQRWQQRA